MAIRRDITAADGVFTGTDTTVHFTIYPPGTTQAQIDAGATAQNITGYTFQWELRLNRWASGTPPVRKTNIAPSNPTAGKVDVQVNRADWIDLTPGDYWHQLARIDSGNATIDTDGSFTLLQGVR